MPRHRSPRWDHGSVQVDDRQMSGWRCLYLAPLFFFTVYLAGLGLVLGSWSIQWFAAYVLLFGALVLLGMIGGAAYAISVGRSMCCLLYTSPSPRDKRQSRMPSSA